MFYPGSTLRRPPAPDTPLARRATSLFPLLRFGGVALTLLAPLRTAPLIPLAAASAAAVHRVGVREARVVRSSGSAGLG